MQLVADLQYFSPLIYYSDVDSLSNCILEQYEYFRKMSFRNRCTLSGANGPIQLTVPLSGGRDQKALMKEIRIDNREAWQPRHWKTIESCYNKSPFLDHYRDELYTLYTRTFVFLVDWNLACLNWICDKMSIATQISLSQQYVKDYDPQEFIDHRNLYLPATMSRLPAPEPYEQVFADRFGFIPHLSVLDKLLCDGPRLGTL